MTRKKQETSGKGESASIHRWADEVIAITENPKQRGIEIRFNAEPSLQLQPKLRAMSFRHSKMKTMWYGDSTPEALEFAVKVKAALPASTDGPDLFLSPSVEAVRTNIENREFSFVMITLTDGQVKNYIIFEASKPKAEVIASNFARQEFGDTFLSLAALPKTHIKEARTLFDEGKIIYPEGQKVPTHKASIIKGLKPKSSELTEKNYETEGDKKREVENLALQKFYKWAAGKPEFVGKTDSISRELFDNWLKENYPELGNSSIENMWRSHERIIKSFKRYEKRSTGKPLVQPYSAIYKKLMQIIPDLIKHIEAGKDSGKSVKDPKAGLMNLNFDYLGKDKKGNYLIALSHLFEQNGDMVPDPDMQIRILPEMEMAEAMTFQDQYGYQEVYPDQGDGKEYVDLRRKKELNQFLSQWLANIIKQGHKIDLTQEESETEDDDSLKDEPFTTSKTKENPKPEFERLHSSEEEKEIIEQFLAQGFTRPFSAQEAFDKNLPVIDLAFRYVESMEYFRDNIENPRKKKVQELREELKNLKGEKGVNDQKNSLKEQIEQLEAEMTFAEKLVQDESLIFQDDLFAIILQKGKQRGYAEEIEGNISSFRDYVVTNILDNRAIENYHKDPVQIVVNELIDEYFNSKEENNTPEMKSSNTPAPAIAEDLKSGDTFLPNVLVPAGTKEPFLAQNFQLYDMKSVVKTNFPHLLKINKKNLSKAPAIEMFELMQMGHPSEYGIDVNRITLLKEWEEKGKEYFEELGFPTDNIYPYVNLHLGYESIEPLGEILSDNNKEGNEWWAVVEHCRPIANAKKALEIIEQQIQKQRNEKKGLINPKTNKPKLEYKHLASDIDHTVENLEDSKEVLQYYIDNPIEAGHSKKVKKETKDPLTNDSGVYTKKTAGKNYERIEIPMPKAAQYEAAIIIVKTSNKDYKIGLDASKKFGDYEGLMFGAGVEGQSYSTREEALKYAFKQHELKLELLLIAKDSILDNEEKKVKNLNTALQALRAFAEKNGISLEIPSASKKDNSSDTSIIKGLEAAYWTEEDNKYPQNKVLVNGMTIQQARLRDAITNKLEKLPLPTLLAITDELSKKFKERRPLDTYEKGYVTIGQTGDKRKAALIAIYIDNMIVDNDLAGMPGIPVMSFLVKLLYDDSQKFVDLPQHIEKQVPKKMKKQSQHELNKEIEAFIENKDKEGRSFNEEEKNYIRQYTGSGGLIKEGAAGRGVLYEYYTPDIVVQKMWGMAFKYGYDGGSVLEPSVGTGNFLKYAPKGAIVFGFETNHFSARIAQILYPNAHIHEKSFESLFFAGNIHLKDDFDHPLYSLVIGNPPYGDFTGKYAGMGEKQWTGATEYDQYFILRGLDLLKKGGLLVFVLPSSFLSYNVKSAKVKEKIASKVDFMDAYRLPIRTFETTDIGTDILLLRKK